MSTTTSTRRPAARAGQRGFSLLEVLLATVLVAYSIASIDALFTAGSAKAAHAEDSGTARLLAQEIQVLARLLPRELATAAATSPSEVTCLGSLDGASFSPPILADLTEAQGLDDWTQEVSVGLADLQTLSGATRVLAADGLEEEASNLLRVQVVVRQGGQEQGTYGWWMRP